jgi:hypothetical protein
MLPQKRKAADEINNNNGKIYYVLCCIIVHVLFQGCWQGESIPKGMHIFKESWCSRQQTTPH